MRGVKTLHYCFKGGIAMRTTSERVRQALISLHSVSSDEITDEVRSLETNLYYYMERLKIQMLITSIYRDILDKIDPEACEIADEEVATGIVGS
jgi:hypothetical protein